MGPVNLKPPDHGYGNPPFYGHDLPVWVRWADFMDYDMNDGMLAQDTIAALCQLKLSNPDKWAAFVAAQRIQGRKVE